MNTRWTFSTLGCPELGLADVAALAGRWGMADLELRCLNGRLDLPALFEEMYGTPEDLARTLADGPARVQALDTSLRLIGATDADREGFLRFIPWAEALRVPWLRVFDGGTHGEPLTDAQADEAAGTVQWWQALRRRSGWSADIVMETHDACITSLACLRIEQKLVEPLAILWDTHHTWRAGEPVAQTWLAMAPFVRHVHVKDSVTDPAVPVGHHYVLPGTGEFPWGELQEAWLQTPYEGVVSLEWERKWHPELPPLEDALAAARVAGWF